MLQNHSNSYLHVDGLVQERCNSSALAMELRLSCTNPSMCCIRGNKDFVFLSSFLTMDGIVLQQLSTQTQSTLGLDGVQATQHGGQLNVATSTSLQNEHKSRVNSLAPGRPRCHFKTAIFNLVLLICIFTSSKENALK